MPALNPSSAERPATAEKSKKRRRRCGLVRHDPSAPAPPKATSRWCGRTPGPPERCCLPNSLPRGAADLLLPLRAQPPPHLHLRRQQVGSAGGHLDDLSGAASPLPGQHRPIERFTVASGRQRPLGTVASWRGPYLPRMKNGFTDFGGRSF